MTWICNLLLTIIATLWSFWVAAFGRADLEAPFFKWVLKCWEAKEKNGGIAWNEFLALMKYLSLHYIQDSEADKLYRYADYVDVSDYYRYIQQGDIEMSNDEDTHIDYPPNKSHEEFIKEHGEPVTENKKVWWQEEYKPYTAFEPHKKQIDNNALEESIISMIQAHRIRYEEEVDKTVKSILKPKQYPNASIHLLSDIKKKSVLKVFFDQTGDADAYLLEKLKESKYYVMFEKEETDSSTVSLILDFHNDEELARETILEILMTVYDQPQECAIGYVNNVSGYTMQEKGIDNASASGCGFWTWFWVLLIIAIIVWIFFL